MSNATITEGTTTRVYTPDSPLRNPAIFLRTIARDARAARLLAWRLFVRDISAQYRQTAIGYLWAALPAVLTALVWVALQAVGVITVSTGKIPYIAYVLVGTTFWQLFVDALNSPLKQLNANRAMLNRINFPTEAIFASGIAQVLFSFLIKIVVLGVVLAIVGSPLSWAAPAVLLPAFALLLAGTAVGMLLAPAGILYQDIQQGLTFVVGPLMFLTPVLYSIQSAGVLGKYMRFNPLTPAFEVIREFLFGGVGPYLLEFGLVTAASLVLVVVGWLVYRLSLPILVERIEA